MRRLHRHALWGGILLVAAALAFVWWTVASRSAAPLKDAGHVPMSDSARIESDMTTFDLDLRLATPIRLWGRVV
jgi:hypothetical protein